MLLREEGAYSLKQKVKGMEWQLLGTQLPLPHLATALSSLPHHVADPLGNATAQMGPVACH